MPGLRQRCFPLLGKSPALANLPVLGRTFQCGFITLPHLNHADLNRGFWKMNVDIAVAAVVSVRLVNNRLAPKWKIEPRGPCWLEDGPATFCRCASKVRVRSCHYARSGHG